MNSDFKNKVFKIVNLENVFSLWLITLPFGSKLASYSFKGFTIYPSLVLALVLALFVFKTIKKWPKFVWIFSAFLLSWLIYAVSFVFLYGKSEAAIFDIRSLGMQFLYFIVFVTAFYSITKQDFFERLKNGFKIYLYLILACGIIEFFTGNHFQGTTTDKFLNLQIGNIFNAPLFLYDNANDYLLYVIFLLFLNIILDKSLQDKFYKRMIFYIIILVFAIYAESVLSKYTLLTLIIGELLLKLFSKRKEVYSYTGFIISALFLILVFYKNPIFYGPKYKHSKDYRINGLKLIAKEDSSYKLVEIKDTFSLREQSILINQLDSLERNNPQSSINERKNLILNGLDFIKEKPLLGIGPGMYKIRHNEKKVKHFTHTLNSAHNFPIEIISQFGLFAWVYFGFVLWFFYQFLRYRIKTKDKTLTWTLILLCACPFFWLMPSAYLYLDLNWILIPLLFIILNAHKSHLIQQEND